MSPLIPFAVQYGPGIANWMLDHREELGDAFTRISSPVFDSLSNRGTIDRIGPALVNLQDGQTQVLGMLQEQTLSLEGISNAVDYIGLATNSIAHSVGILTSLSMVGLGLSVFSTALILQQFRALNKRLNELQGQVAEIKTMMQAEYLGALTAGLNKLSMATEKAPSDPEKSVEFFRSAHSTLTDSSARYVQLLRNATRAENPQFAWMLSRQLSVSVLAEALVCTHRNESKLAAKALELAVEPLRNHAKLVFERTVASKPTKFLIPSLAASGLTLERLAELYRQAHYAGISSLRPNTEELFEHLRSHMGSATDPVLWPKWTVKKLLAEFSEAATAIEEVNRIQGLILLIRRYDRPDRTIGSLSEVIAESMHKLNPSPEPGTVFAVFPASQSD